MQDQGDPPLVVLRILCHLLLLQRVAGEHQLAQVAEPGLATADCSDDVREWVEVGILFQLIVSARTTFRCVA